MSGAGGIVDHARNGVIYKDPGGSTWATNTGGRYGVLMRADGNLVLYGPGYHVRVEMVHTAVRQGRRPRPAAGPAWTAGPVSRPGRRSAGAGSPRRSAPAHPRRCRRGARRCRTTG